jgi:hypothetical protein
MAGGDEGGGRTDWCDVLFCLGCAISRRRVPTFMDDITERKWAEDALKEAHGELTNGSEGTTD